VKNNAILLLSCPDQKGIVAAVTDFLLKNEGNVIDIDQHVDTDNSFFFMRVEWEMEGFNIPPDKIDEYFHTLVGAKFQIKSDLRFTNKTTRLALFVSKYSHCLFDILSRHQAGEWDVEIPMIISNHESLSEVAKSYKIPFQHIPINKESKPQQEQKQINLLKEQNIDLVVLARYMQILSKDFVKHYPNQIINIHHSSLPAFIGANPYRAAFNRGVKFMGATAHYVTTDLDEGPIIAQDITQISHRDSVSDMKRKGRDIEKIVLAQAIWSHINHNVMVHGNKTVVFE
jgi:formyltetrahydrofolate deformylase